ncbi:MAG TPA: acyl-CoA dehydrogenase family protein [Baekduia sp.]
MAVTETTGVPTAEEILARAEALVPALAARAERVEEERRVPDETMEDLRAAGLLNAVSPPSVGGPGHGVPELGQIVRTLAHGCASTAWVYGFLVGHNAILVRDAPDLLDASGFHAAAASAGIQGNPSVTATPVEGGWRVTGTWKFLSGILNAEHVLLITLQDNGDDDPTPIGLTVPVAAGEIEDVWRWTGMRGTASNTFHLTGAFVPAHRQWSLPGLEPVNAPVVDSRMNVPTGRLFKVITNGVAVGIAEQAVADFRARILTRVVGYGQGPQREHREAWARYADAVIRLKTARLLWDDMVDMVARTAAPDVELTVEEGAMVRLAESRVPALAREAVQVVMDGSGSSVNHLDDPLQRQVRDLDTVKSHSTLHWDHAAVTAGATLLGIEGYADSLIVS